MESGENYYALVAQINKDLVWANSSHFISNCHMVN